VVKVVHQMYVTCLTERVDLVRADIGGLVGETRVPKHVATVVLVHVIKRTGYVISAKMATGVGIATNHAVTAVPRMFAIRIVVTV